ncbi:MAG: DUF996 domain-containing protein [Candidatus Bathyarchaeota archaeon]|nr:DUF996 domain-containing protein [Candidatus Bathyarchaeota archaeon]
MTIQTNRTLGGVGACLTLTGLVSTILSIIQYAYPALMMNPAILGISGVVGIISFAGFILFFIAMYGFSRDYGEHKIFNYILYGLIGTIVSAVVAGVILTAYIMLNLFDVIRSLNPVPNLSSQIQSLLTPYYAPFVTVISVVMLVWILFNYKAYNLLADKTGVYLFRSAAKIFVIGAFVNIVVGVVFTVLAFNLSTGFTTIALVALPGGLVQYIAWVLVARAFFRIEPLPLHTQTFRNET